MPKWLSTNVAMVSTTTISSWWSTHAPISHRSKRYCVGKRVKYERNMHITLFPGVHISTLQQSHGCWTTSTLPTLPQVFWVVRHLIYRRVPKFQSNIGTHLQVQIAIKPSRTPPAPSPQWRTSNIIPHPFNKNSTDGNTNWCSDLNTTAVQLLSGSNLILFY